MSVMQLAVVASSVVALVVMFAASFASTWARTEREVEHLERVIRNRRSGSRVDHM